VFASGLDGSAADEDNRPSEKVHISLIEEEPMTKGQYLDNEGREGAGHMEAPDEHSRTRLLDYLPAVYREFLPVFFEREVNSEVLSDCEHCPMLEQNQSKNPLSLEVFSPKTKCCTYHPNTPNYLVGRLLDSDDPAVAEGKKRLMDKLEKRVGVMPIGVHPSRKYLVLYKEGKRKAFGKAVSLRCPYYDEKRGGCTIWIARADACATYFCKSVSGIRGREFWKLVQRYLQKTQRDLSIHALKKLHVDITATMERLNERDGLTPWELDDYVPDEVYSALWGAWEGRETELYLESYRIISSITREDFVRIRSNDRILPMLEKAREALLTANMPQVLKLNPSLTVSELGSGNWALHASWGNFEVSQLVLTLLRLFDGKNANYEIVRHAKEKLEVDLTDDYLNTMYQNGILVDALSSRR
jgi:hypothetical protein